MKTYNINLSFDNLIYNLSVDGTNDDNVVLNLPSMLEPTNKNLGFGFKQQESVILTPCSEIHLRVYVYYVCNKENTTSSFKVYALNHTTKQKDTVIDVDLSLLNDRKTFLLDFYTNDSEKTWYATQMYFN